MPIDYLERILTAHVYDVAIESPFELAPRLSQRLDNRLFLKREDMQPVFSFKLRGAYNKMAKLHIRHMVGGHAPHAEHEILYRFEFPERLSALMNFLQSMSHNWNISLFHYRNHGTDIGRVLAGIQVPPEDMHVFQDFLEKLGYVYCEETHNPPYRLFLSDV